MVQIGTTRTKVKQTLEDIISFESRIIAALQIYNLAHLSPPKIIIVLAIRISLIITFQIWNLSRLIFSLGVCGGQFTSIKQFGF